MTGDDDEPPFTLRCAEQHGSYVVQLWSNADSDTELIVFDIPQTLPAWLRTIIDVATVAGEFKRTNHPPPDRILWAELDNDYSLLRFR